VTDHNAAIRMQTRNADSPMPGETGGNPAADIRQGGFTLIELIVVMALMSIVLFVSVPRIDGTFLQDDARRSSRWLIGKIQTLRENAVRNQLDYTLQLDLDTNRAWETNSSMTADSMQSAADNAYLLPGDVRLTAVIYPRRGRVSSGRTGIRFYRGGYSDKALIQMHNGDQPLTFALEPFISKVTTYERLITYEDRAP
jgi:prepilin-type N-terminal cleavage/methylation domain-containing protein